MKTNKTTNRATNKALTFKQRLALAVHSARFSVYYINPQLAKKGV